MLQVKNLFYAVGERHLFKGTDWVVNPRRRLALIGPNGTGKTTLFRILTEEIKSYQGEIVKPKGFRIGYLPQEEVPLEGTSVLRTVLEGHKEVFELEDKITELHIKLDEASTQQDQLLYQMGELEREYESKGGYKLEVEAKTILSGLGFLEKDHNSPLTEFSGGWRMRVYLARLLVQKPNLLLLDEPTNHLDLPSLEWLEKYLQEFSGSIVFVSHDRMFIDRLADEIYELEDGLLVKYPGKYHIYEEKKAQREELLRKRREELIAERERQERFIERFRAKNTKATQVQSRIKYLEKLEKVDLPEPVPKLHFELSVDSPSYKDVLQFENVSFRYNENWIVNEVHLHLCRGDRIALVGKNGAGKTTLSRLAAGEFPPQRGKVILGQRVSLGYYAQHQVDMLDLNANVYDEVSSSVAENAVPYIRNVLGTFNFSGDDVFKKIKVLSGGEKARVSLAKILLSPVNFLIMDEPTNHLDLNSIEALEYALSKYNGTLLLISHDRYFLDKLVTRVVEVSDGRAEEYWGNYSDYLEKKEKTPEIQPVCSQSPKKESYSEKHKERKRRAAEARQAVSRDRARLNKEIDLIENRIENLEKRKKEIEMEMTKPDTYSQGEKVVALQKEHSSLNKDLPKLYQDWEKKRLQLENLLQQISQEIESD